MKPSIRIALPLVIALFGAAATAAAEPVLCVKEKKEKPRGKVNVRDGSCKGNEIQLDLGDFGLGALRSDLEAQIAELREEVEIHAAQLADVQSALELLAVQQNHATETASIDNFAENDFTSMVGLGVVAPFDGFLMVWADLNAEYDISSDAGTNADLECRIALDGADSSILVDQEFADVAGGTNSGESIAVSTVVPVSAGSHTVDLQCRRSGSAQLFVKQRALTTLFVTLEGETPRVLPVPLPLPGPLPVPVPLSAAKIAPLNE